MHRLKSFRHKSAPVQSQPAVQAPTRPDTSWEAIGPAKIHLAGELEKLYWDAIKHELQNIIDTLRIWRQPEYAAINVEDDDHIHGFDTFIDHVSQEARVYAVDYGNEKQNGSTSSQSKDPYIASLENVIRDVQAERSRTRIRTEVRELLRTHASRYTGTHRLAQMLLQAAGFLDIDQIFEHAPSKTFGIPQLKISGYNKQGIPIFAPQECTACNAIIQGSMFTKPPATIICEDCYFARHYDDAAFIKKHKHCVLDAIDAPMSQRLCLCRDVVRVDAQGGMRNLFPIDADDNHLNADGGFKCMLVRLTELVAQAKYEGLRAVLHPTQSQSRTKRSLSQRISGRREPVRQTAAPTDTDVAQLLCEIEQKHPVRRRSALRIGPVLVETDSRTGVVISPREPPVFHEQLPLGPRRCLAIAADSTLSQGERLATPRRILAVQKQVVGAPFTGLDDTTLEREVIELIVAASEADAPSEDAVQTLLRTLHALLDPRLKTYLTSLTSRLIESPPSNNESLVSTLLDASLFRALIPNTDTDTKERPLYLISFLSPSSCPVPHTKHDIAPGLLQDYLRTPLHGPSDFIDALTGHWTDWGASPPGNALFPWDCTEAYNPTTPRCSTCSLSKHLWAYPVDAWSTIAHHFTRPPFLYPAPSLQGRSASTSDSDGTDWPRNRHTLLSASQVLVRTALAMARSPRFCAATAWLAQPQTATCTDPKRGHDDLVAQMAGYARAGGIHRAQPGSDISTRRPFFLAPWAGLAPEPKKEWYARVREEMVRRVDIAPLIGGTATTPYGYGYGYAYPTGMTGTMSMSRTATVATGVGLGLGLGVAVASSDEVPTAGAQIGVVWCEFTNSGTGGSTNGTYSSVPANCGSAGCGSASQCGGGCGGSGGGDGGGGGGCGGGSGGGGSGGGGSGGG